jgi:hypothetical protein
MVFVRDVTTPARTTHRRSKRKTLKIFQAIPVVPVSATG